MQVSKLPDHISKRIKICKHTGCWNYEGKDPSSNGYQRAYYKGVRSAVHRIVYNLLVGGNIEGKDIDHSCCNITCCNPEHLKPMSHRMNCQLREKRRKLKNHNHSVRS
mgnify:CR=1 FL=1|jgi:hypothetical protein